MVHRVVTFFRLSKKVGCFARVAEVAWDVLSRVANLCGMFCPGWQIFVGCFVQGGKKWHGIFCPSFNF